MILPEMFGLLLPNAQSRCFPDDPRSSHRVHGFICDSRENRTTLEETINDKSIITTFIPSDKNY